MADITAAIITVSDRGFQGERRDRSGPEIQELLESEGIAVLHYALVPDEKVLIADKIREFTDEKNADLVLTTGGTGVSPRDVTPDATRDVIDRDIPGLAEYMRMKSAALTPHALVSRAVAGIRKNALIINLPGSPKGARENLSFILPALRHAIEKIKGDPSECAS
jgi:molybdopterin adenylyltransferase